MNQQEIWQVEVQGQVYEANFEELTQWIAEGALLREDKVRRGNLRWLEAGKIPTLYGFFNAKELGIAPPPVVTTIDNAESQSAPIDTAAFSSPPSTQTESPALAQNFSNPNHTQATPPADKTFTQSAQTNTQSYAQPHQATAQNFQNFQNFNGMPPASAANSCSLHPAEEPKFICDTCQNLFCKTCPRSYGGSVKICPACGSMCRPLAEFQNKQQKAVQYNSDLARGFGFADFGNALAFPFRFRFSLISGAILFAFFTLGQAASSFGGFMMVGSAIICLLMANAISFGCLANTVDNFAQGHLDENFMPSFDDFSLWDDVVHPFFLSLAAYLVSFGPVVLLLLGMMWYAVSSVTTATQESFSQMREQAEHVQEISNARRQNEALLENQPQAQPAAPAPESLDDAEIQELEKMIHQQRKQELESVVGKSPETKQKENAEMLGRLLRVGAAALVLGFVGLVWGLFYFPAACAVAGYTRSFRATINPLVGLDTIRRMGFDYVKILFMCFLLTLMSGTIGGVIATIFAPFDLPGVGNLPGNFVSSLFTFYFSVVFAATLGYALYKNSAKLNLYRS